MRLSELRVSHNLLSRSSKQLVGLIVLAAILEVAAAVGVSYLAGFHEVRSVLDRFQPIWLLGTAGGVALSFVGYFWTYRTVYRTDEGPTLSGRRMWAVVVAGFGGFLAHGGAALDQYAMEGGGAEEREASVRVGALGGLEHGILGLLGTVAGIVALAMALSAPPLDVQLPWTVLPIPGFLFAFWLSARYAERFRDREGLAGKLGVFLDTVEMVRHMFTKPLRNAGAMAGMAIFWGADIFAAWCALAAFGIHLNGAAFLLGFGTGAVFTRRTGPLGGAGVLMLVLPITLWYAGAPLASAVAGIFVFRVMSLWVPMPLCLGALPTLREIGTARPGAEGAAEQPSGEPALAGRSS